MTRRWPRQRKIGELDVVALHEKAPGVLGVVFGQERRFEGAPRWTGPVCFWREGWEQPEWLHVRQIEIPGRGLYDGGWAEVEACFFDMEVLSVFSRMAGLCCLALGCSPVGASLKKGTWEPTWKLVNEDGEVGRWGEHGHVLRHVGLIPNVENAGLYEESFLSALVLTLAPQIKALGDRDA